LNERQQNVILELGYFIGILGRERVCALKQALIDIPSDLHGVIYVELDSMWQLRLAREMKEAGLEVDLNLVICCYLMRSTDPSGEVSEQHHLAYDVVAESPAAKGKPVLALAGRHTFQFFDVVQS
jgi:Predicted nucleotide-binding protein containing TIR-like domain